MGVRLYKETVVGDRFGRLVVVCRSTRPARYPHYYWDCKCDCGEFKTVSENKLKSGEVRSCGCLRREICSTIGKTNRIHGEAVHGQETVEFRTWLGIKARTSDPRYKYYAGQGVIMCDRWRDSFETFLADVGRRPSDKHSIDRYPDPYGNYEPGNVRWATRKEQQRNLRTNHLLTVNGETMCLSAWEERHELPKRILSKRIKAGRSLTDLFLPSSRNAARSESESKLESQQTTQQTKTKGA